MLKKLLIFFLTLTSCLFIASRSWGQISDVTPRLEAASRDDLGFTRSDIDNDVSNTFFTRQSHKLILDIPLTSVFLLSYNMRYSDLETRLDFRADDGSVSVNNSSNEIFEPQVELLWDNVYFFWNNGFRFRKSDVETDFFGVTRTEENYFSRLEILEAHLFPKTLVRYDWVRRSDNLLVPGLDLNDNTVTVELDKSMGPIRLLYDFDASRSDNDISHLTETRLNQDGRVSISQSFWDDRIRMFGRYGISADRTISSRPPLSETMEVTFVNEFEADQGLFLEGDPLDIDPTDDLLASGFADLIDEDTSTAANPPGAPSEVDLKEELQNIGVRLQVNRTVDTIFVYIVRPATVTEETLEAISWRVFVGTDADEWTEIAGVTVSFNILESRFEFILPATSGRFFRVRNEVGSGTIEQILITEMVVASQAVGEEELRFRRRRVTETLDQDVATSLTFQPFRVLAFRYNFNYGQDMVEPEGEGSLRRIHSGTVSFFPHPIFRVSGLAQRTYSDPSGREDVPSTDDRLSVSISSTTLPTLTQSATFSRRERSERPTTVEEEVDVTRDDTFLYSVTGEIYRNFTLGVDFTWARSWDFTLNLPATITARADIRADIEVRPDLRISGDYRAGRERGGSLENRQRINNGTFTISYRPTPRINAEVDLLFRSEEGIKNLDQTYRLNWIVFAGGSVDFFVDYELSKREEEALEEHIGGVFVRWKVNRKMQFDVRWNVQSENNSSRVLRQSATASLTLRL